MLAKTAQSSRRYDINLKDINQLQHNIMVFVTKWAHSEKVPISHKQIVEELQRQGVKKLAVAFAIKALLRKGYIRKTVSFSKRAQAYVQLRGV